MLEVFILPWMLLKYCSMLNLGIDQKEAVVD